MSYPVFRAFELDSIVDGGTQVIAERDEQQAVVPSVRLEVRVGGTTVEAHLGPNDARRLSGWIAEVLRTR